MCSITIDGVALDPLSSFDGTDDDALWLGIWIYDPFQDRFPPRY